MTSLRPTCDQPECDREGTAHYRLDPTNLRERRRVLCAPHAREHGYTKVDHQRPARHGTHTSGRARSDT